MDNKKSNKYLGLVIVDGVGYRNCILSNLLTEAQSGFDKITIFSGLPLSVFDGIEGDTIDFVSLDDFRESSWTWFFRKAKEVAHLHLVKEDNFGITDNLKAAYTPGSSRRARLNRFIHKWTGLFHSETWIERYHKWQEASFKNHPTTQKYLDTLGELNPDVLYFTHQRPPYIAPLIYAARKREVPTTTFIFSWDNLASKGRMAGTFDHYHVWSELMKEELLQYYKKVTPEQITVVGTPQFEPYVMDVYHSEPEVFYKTFNLDPEVQTLCFSCGDIATSKNDELYIRTIAQAINDGRLSRKLNFLVRTSPAETPERFEKLRQKFPFITWNVPKWNLSREDHSELWSQRVPTVTDAQELRMILNYADVGVNMCSTMSLDFMQFGKPVINPVFGTKENGLYNDQRFLKFAHYKRVVESGAVAIVKTPQELIQEIKNSLANPNIRLEAQQELLKVQTQIPLEGTSKRIIENLVSQ